MRPGRTYRAAGRACTLLLRSHTATRRTLPPPAATCPARPSVYDALERAHQCATVQLDFNLPERFDLSYQASGTEAKDALVATSSEAERALAEGGKMRPVMIHRAVLGSVERMIAILTEHYAGKWPLWLSPRQIVIVPVTKMQLGYAEELRQIFHANKFFVDVDTTLNKLPKMILNAQKEQCAPPVLACWTGRHLLLTNPLSRLLALCLCAGTTTSSSWATRRSSAAP